MKKILVLALTAILACGAASAQHCGNCPHHKQQAQQQQCKQPAALQYNADGIETTILKAFPEAKSVKKTDKWTEVYNAKKKLIGYAVYSKPASDGIKGYAAETPVLIAMSKKQVIIGVYMLPNVETPNFVKHIEDKGFFNCWNGLTVKQAKKKQVDTVSGATFTSRAVVQSVQAALEKL
jgi:Na+-translocating ferredoxin:NAD+ oxidoreductase RnfG subunit